jgi:hypothetical protein
MDSKTATAQVNVTIEPISGSGVQQLGMFQISVTPKRPTDQIINLQYIVSVSNQPPGDFVSFIFIGDLPVGAGLPSSIFYASCDAVNANRDGGYQLVVEVVGAVNSTPNMFSVTKTFSGILWPEGSCYAFASRN